MKVKIEEILNKLIAEVIGGRSIDECLKEHAEYAEELRPLLSLAKSITELPKPEPNTEAVEATIQRATALAHKQKAVKRFSFREIFVLRPVAVRVFAAILLVLALAVTTVSLSANSLPGDMFYPVKIAAERVQLFLTIDDKGKARLHAIFAVERTDEFESLLEPGVEISEELLERMLRETDLAIACVMRLDGESAAKVIDQIDDCCHYQMAALEKARDCACQMDIEMIEKAMEECMEQHECLECIRESKRGDKSFAPCNGRLHDLS